MTGFLYFSAHTHSFLLPGVPPTLSRVSTNNTPTQVLISLADLLVPILACHDLPPVHPQPGTAGHPPTADPPDPSRIRPRWTDIGLVDTV